MTAPATSQPKAIEVPTRNGGRANIAQLFAAKKDALAALLPKHLSADRLIKVALFSMARTPALQACTAESLLTALMRSAEAGLEVDGIEAALVPYKGEATLVPMYQGLLKLAHQHPKVIAVDADVVREGDRFRHRKGLEPLLEHIKADSGRGEVTHAWAVAFLKGGGRQSVVLTLEDIQKTRERSPSAKSGKSTPWETDFEAMARKTAIKRLASMLPKTSRMKAAIEGDEVEGEVVSRVEGELLGPVGGIVAPAAGVAGVRAKLASKRPPPVMDVGAGESEEDASARYRQQELDAAGEPGGAG